MPGGRARGALRPASRPGRREDATISACLEDGSDSDELQAVGAALLASTADLSAAAAERPDGPEATQLGYLIGAVRRSASSSEGTSSELVRRLEQELLALGQPSEAFRRGERAGREGG